MLDKILKNRKHEKMIFVKRIYLQLIRSKFQQDINLQTEPIPLKNNNGIIRYRRITSEILETYLTLYMS